MKLIKLDIPDHPYSDVFDILKNGLDFEKGPWIAGGILRRILMGEYTSPHDIDVFAQTTSHEVEQLCVLASESIDQKRNSIINRWDWGNTPLSKIMKTVANRDARPMSTRDHHGGHVQYTTRPDITTPDSLMKDFDFTVCQLISDGEYIWATEEAIRDIQDRRLNLTTPTIRTSSSRIIRYTSNGFNPSLEVIEKLSNETEYHYYENVVGVNLLNSIQCGEDSLHDLSVLGELNSYHIDFDNNIVMVGKHPFPLHMGLTYLLVHNKNSIVELMKPEWLRLRIYGAPPNITAMLGDIVKYYQSVFL
jgi:hypothetical protein